MTRTPLPVTAPARPDLAERLPEFRAALEQQRQFRIEQLQELADAAANSAPAFDSVHDEVGEILTASARSALADIEAALDGLRAGSYGDCARCTQPISWERLEILPMSRYCIRCQHALEMRSV